MKKTRKVKFVVGMTLDGPIEVTHVITEEEIVSKSFVSSKGKDKDGKTTAEKVITKGPTKTRNACGQSQRDARIRQQEKKQNKK